MILKKDDLAKKIKEEEEKKRSQQFKAKLSERNQNKKLPKLARLKVDHSLECILCKFTCLEEISFSKHYSNPSHKNALEEFQKNYAKKSQKELKEQNPEEKEKESLPVIGVKRPPVLEFKVEEKYVLIESEDKENRTEEKKPEDLQNPPHPNNSANKFSVNEYIEFLDEEEESKDPKSDNVNVPSRSQNNHGISNKNNGDSNNKDEEIEKNLMNFLEREEESFSSHIMNNLQSLKKQKNEKKEGIMKIEEDFKDQKQNLHLEENLDVGDLFNWKKKKLF